MENFVGCELNYLRLKLSFGYKRKLFEMKRPIY